MSLIPERIWTPGITLFLAFLLLVLGNLHTAGAGQATSAVPRILDLRAFLYYHDRGEFSRQDLLSGQMALWNVIGGAGDAEAPSAATLVLVTVGPPLHPDRNIPSLRLSVKYGKRTTLNQEVSLGPFSSLKSPIHIPFLLYKTGCERLELTARLTIGSRELGTLSRAAEFKCGE